MHQVFNHDVARVGIGIIKRTLGLRVERFLANGDNSRRLLRKLGNDQSEHILQHIHLDRRILVPALFGNKVVFA